MVRPAAAGPHPWLYPRATARGDPPITQEEWQAFLQSWWHAAPGTQRHGRAGLAEVIEQLQGFELPAGEWERIFAERVESYRPEWLDDLCLSGEVTWGRLSVLEPVREADDPAAAKPIRATKTPSRRTPITFMLRQDLPWLMQAHRGTTAPAEPGAGSGREVLDALRGRGALFTADLQSATERLPTDVEEGLWDGVARGLITADGWGAVRSLLNARTRLARRQRPARRPGSRGRRGTWRQAVGGRWTLLPAAQPIDELEELAETVAWQLLLRWGVVFRDVYLKERLTAPVARDSVGAAPAGGPRRHPRRLFRHRRDRRAIRARQRAPRTSPPAQDPAGGDAGRRRGRPSSGWIIRASAR